MPIDAVLPMYVEVESLHERSMFARRENEDDDEGDEPLRRSKLRP